MFSAWKKVEQRQAALDQVGRLAAVPTDPVLTPNDTSLLLGEFDKIPAEVDHNLANLVLPAYRLREARETPGSTPPANLSQSAIILSRYCLTLVVVASAWSIRARAAAER